MDRVISTLGTLLRPTDATRRSIVVVADDRWTVHHPLVADAGPDVAAIVWGRAPSPSGTPLVAAGRSAVRRELSIASIRTRPPAGLRVKGVHRFGPQRAGTGRLRREIRKVLLGGAAVELTAARSEPRVLDGVLADAGVVGGPSRVRISSGGAALVLGRDASGRGALVRLAPRGEPADPARSIEALRSLEEARVPGVPRLLDHGLTSGISWAVESVLPGRRPDALTDRLAQEARDVLASFPRDEGPPAALVDDLAVIERLAPTRAEGVRTLSSSVDVVDLPSVLRHGDLWAGNLLTVRGSLSGIVDWDAWHPRAVPGADLLELVASGERLRARRPLGAVWGERPWRGAAFTALADPYWGELGFRPTDDDLEIVGLAWWAAKVAGTLIRLPERGVDGPWLELIVDPVLDDLRA
jgi:hypothetical protein